MTQPFGVRGLALAFRHLTRVSHRRARERKRRQATAHQEERGATSEHLAIFSQLCLVSIRRLPDARFLRSAVEFQRLEL